MKTGEIRREMCATFRVEEYTGDVGNEVAS